MRARKEGHTQIVAAAKAGLSERSGRNIEQGKRKDPWSKGRWRSCPDPFAKVWESELKPMLEQVPTLTGITLLEHLQDQHPGDYPDCLLRTLQRRVKQWRALCGPQKEVMFRQVHELGRQGLSDFTKLKRVSITIKGRLFEHLLYHFRLSCSHWSFIKVIQGGESYTALAEGLQEALASLGGCPKEHRTDSLSAAFKNIDKKAQEDITTRYDDLCRNYGMTPTRNNRGQGHENGSVESPHGHLKRRIEQALLLRGSNDFESVQSYQAFIDAVVAKANRRNAKT
ncbi:MAG: IS21 family transposase, partial [Alphaproteobacteria bacterium]